MKVFLSGQKFFGLQVLRFLLADGHQVVGVCCPLDDQYVGPLARAHAIPITPAGTLSHETMPRGVDLGITAHSFDYVGKRTRYMARLGWIGYHPSLLPRHRGRSSIEWAIRMRDIVTGGSVYWLNAGVDRGDVERQDWIWIPPALFALDPKKAAAQLWRSDLLPMGVRLLREAVKDISCGKINRTPQDPELSTFEPSTDVRDVYRPDLLMLPAPGAEDLQNGREVSAISMEVPQTSAEPAAIWKWGTPGVSYGDLSPCGFEHPELYTGSLCGRCGQPWYGKEKCPAGAESVPPGPSAAAISMHGPAPFTDEQLDELVDRRVKRNRPEPVKCPHCGRVLHPGTADPHGRFFRCTPCGKTHFVTHPPHNLSGQLAAAIG